MTFNRWACSWDRTAAFWLFRAHHTQLNALYWANAPAAKYVIQVADVHPPEALTANVFRDVSSDAGRPAPRIGEWTSDYGDFQTWTRLNVAVSLASNLEMYLKMVVSRALESDPGVTIGVPHATDGVSLLKTKTEYSYASSASKVVEGTWQKRVRTYETLLGKVPTVLSEAVTELDSLQRLRNGVAHMFGRDLDAYKAHLAIRPKTLLALSEERLKKWLGLVERVALGVDEHLRSGHIGEYEALLYYHHWIKAYQADPSPTLRTRSLRRSFSEKFGLTVSTSYCRALALHYEEA